MIEITRGSDETVLIELFEDDEVTPMDLSTATTVELYNETIAPDIAITNPVLGQITLTFPDELTEGLKKNGRYVLQIRVWFGADKETTPELVVFAR